MRYRLTLDGAPVTDWTQMKAKEATPWRTEVAAKEGVHPNRLAFQIETEPVKKAATKAKTTKPAAANEKGDDA